MPARRRCLAQDEEEEEEEVHNEPEDPSQPECALSGEPFEKVYDPVGGWGAAGGRGCRALPAGSGAGCS
jgi:hypothetical protein